MRPLTLKNNCAIIIYSDTHYILGGFIMTTYNSLEKKVREIIAVFEEHNYLYDYHDSGTGTLELTFKESMSFDVQRRLKEELAVLLPWDITRIKIIA